MLPFTTFATVEFLSVNKITKQYYWGDDDHSTGWIGWKNVREGRLSTAEDELKKMGYTETRFPYKIEANIGMIVIVASFWSIVKRKRSKRVAS